MSRGTRDCEGSEARKVNGQPTNSIWRAGRVGVFVWDMEAVGDEDSEGQLRQKAHMELQYGTEIPLIIP